MGENFNYFLKLFISILSSGFVDESSCEFVLNESSSCVFFFNIDPKKNPVKKTPMVKLILLIIIEDIFLEFVSLNNENDNNSIFINECLLRKSLIQY